MLFVVYGPSVKVSTRGLLHGTPWPQYASVCAGGGHSSGQTAVSYFFLRLLAWGAK